MIRRHYESRVREMKTSHPQLSQIETVRASGCNRILSACASPPGGHRSHLSSLRYARDYSLEPAGTGGTVCVENGHTMTNESAMFVCVLRMDTMSPARTYLFVVV